MRSRPSGEVGHVSGRGRTTSIALGHAGHDVAVFDECLVRLQRLSSGCLSRRDGPGGTRCLERESVLDKKL